LPIPEKSGFQICAYTIYDANDIRCVDGTNTPKKGLKRVSISP